METGNKKVLIVASVVSFIEWFNKENVFFLKKDLNCEVHIACNFNYMDDTDETRTLAYIEELKKNGIILHNIYFSRSPLKFDNYKAYKELKRIIDNNYFDLIHCHTPTVSIITRIAAKTARKKGTIVAYTCHGFHFHNMSAKKNWLLYYPIERFFSRFCDYIITINSEDYNRTKKFHCKNIRYIPGVGVDINHIKNTTVNKEEYRSSISIPSDSFMIISIGELIERKNHEVIIRALGELKDDSIYYVICGKGPLENYLKSLAISLDIQKQIVFLGFRKDIAELCACADISAFPSKIEGLGLAGIEAMAAGLPLVSSNVHGILDYVKDGITGFACNPNDVKAFSKAIKLLENNTDLRNEMKLNCYEAVEPFEKNNALHEMWIIYKEILL